jgi:hypothetical protein
VASGANVSVGQLGGTGTDRIVTAYTGVMLGTMAVLSAGGPKNDTLFTDLEFQSGSRGKLNPSFMLGLDGNDTLTFIVHDTTVGSTIASPIIDGGAGKNTDFRTTNVLSFNCQVDNLVF